MAVASAAPASARDSQLWSSVATSGTLPGGTLVAADLNSRLISDWERLGHLQARAALGRSVGDGQSLFLGYAFTRTRPEGRPTLHEHRLFQQFSFGIAEVAKARLSGRVRFEQRAEHGSSDIALRLRLQARGQVPLGSSARPPALIAHVETFHLLNSTDWLGEARFDQVRMFFGFGLPVAGQVLEVGYLGQTLTRNGEARTNDALSVGLVTRF